MKRYKDMRIAEHLEMVNKIKKKKITKYNIFKNYKQKKKKNNAMLEYLKYDKLYCTIYNRLLERIPKETIIIQDRKNLICKDFFGTNVYKDTVIFC